MLKLRREALEGRDTNALFDFMERHLSGFPWKVRVCDWRGEERMFGGREAHWLDEPLYLIVKKPSAARSLLCYDALGFLEAYLRDDVDLQGNLFLLSDIKNFAKFELGMLRGLPHLFASSFFQTERRARFNTKSHYDIPQAVLDLYLDREYRSYSCGIFDDPDRICLDDLVSIGTGERDVFDSLEKAQWRKFSQTLDLIDPLSSDSILDIGCGYGGLLRVALEAHQIRKGVGWSHSRNQVIEGAKALRRFEAKRWELNEGDYRRELRVFDHVTSIGMVSHVGPRGLSPYVKNVRTLIRSGGTYVHHDLMIKSERIPQGLQVGPVFNKRHVWPGFHWFTLGQHIRHLERNGFRVVGVEDLSSHYSKTTASWYQRLMRHREEAVTLMGEPAVRAWQVFLAGVSGSLVNGGVDDYRICCRAV